MKVKIATYAVASALYLVGVWFHLPYSGGHVYSDIVTVFAFRFCGSPSGTCVIGVPYISTFMEYPVLVSLFVYSMAILGSMASNSLVHYIMVYDYYYLSALFLAIPTFLLIRECFKILEILKLSSRRILLYVIATPSFVFMLLLNWYIIGVWLSVYALRKHLEGRDSMSGLLFGLSAASNLITAVPMVSALFMSRNWASRVKMAAFAAAIFACVNVPFYLVNPTLWTRAWNWTYSWGIEGSWLYAIFWPDLGTPLRHFIPLITMSVLSLGIILRFMRDKEAGYESRGSEAIKLAWLFTFAFLFSTYIFTPQMNLILLPFFAIAPVTRRYAEFLSFDALNSLVIVLGYSMTLPALFGINYAFGNAGPLTIIPLMTIARSIWVGKFLIFDGLLFPSRLSSVRGSERESGIGVPSWAGPSPQRAAATTSG